MKILKASLGINKKMNAFELINYCSGKTMSECFKIDKKEDINLAQVGQDRPQENKREKSHKRSGSRKREDDFYLR